MNKNYARFANLVGEISDWHCSAFPDAEEIGQLRKLDEEIAELQSARTKKEKLEEEAGIFIVASALVGRWANLTGYMEIKCFLDNPKKDLDKFEKAIKDKMEKIKREF